MLINHNQNMLCLDEFDILELRENADECDYLFVVSPKIKAIFSYNKFSPTIHYATGPSTRSSLNMIQNLMDSYKQISGADIDRLKLGLF